MRTRIQQLKLMRIHADTDPQPCLLLLLQAGVQLGPGPAQLPAEGFQQRQGGPVQHLRHKKGMTKMALGISKTSILAHQLRTFRAVFRIRNRKYFALLPPDP
jgi:hypothetical protein